MPPFTPAYLQMDREELELPGHPGTPGMLPDLLTDLLLSLQRHGCHNICCMEPLRSTTIVMSVILDFIVFSFPRQTTETTMHIVLLGDSVFYDPPYTAGGPAVIDHLQALKEPGDKATLLAVDGHRVADVWSQVASAPAGGTHFFLSIGGNDALDRVELLNHPVRSAGEGMALFGEAVDDFAEAYWDPLNRPEHYANPIEPSVEGGRVLAEEMLGRMRG